MWLIKFNVNVEEEILVFHCMLHPDVVAQTSTKSTFQIRDNNTLPQLIPIQSTSTPTTQEPNTTLQQNTTQEPQSSTTTTQTEPTAIPDQTDRTAFEQQEALQQLVPSPMPIRVQ